jgi:hypothetical protein
MADTRPTKLRLFYKMYLCLLVIVNPRRFIEEEKKDEAKRKSFPPAQEQEHRVYIVRRAFWISLYSIISFGLIGAVVGLLLRDVCGQPSTGMIKILQIIGASLLLWGTLFVRGWDIQTFCGVTLGERVNQWIYRGLYCIGTSIAVASLIWPK